ncbi:uncharacterized protein V6R79_024098 [Siganus canaliculatus]
MASTSGAEKEKWPDKYKDEEEEEEQEDAVPVTELVGPSNSGFNQEKPVFSRSVADPGLCVPLALSSVDEDRVPYTINRYLRDYQRQGIRFMYSNYIRSRGCILGDDMGLGKTVQVIGFLAAVLHKTGTWEDVQNNRPQFLQSQRPSKQSKPNKMFLIVAPLSVLYNWKDELDTWGHFQCVVVHGLRKDEELARIKKGRTEIALTTYETLRLCLDQFNNIDWSAVIVDEAHKIKNPNSQVTQAMKDLKCEIRIGLTGTILQNNLEELWCVMDWAIPGCLGSLGHFKNKISDPIEQGQRHNATKRALAMGRKTVKALVRKISHWFLRRTKALIKEQLPKKDDRVVYCSLTDFQQSVYQTVLDTEDVTLLLRSSEKCGCNSGRTRTGCCYKTNSEGVTMKQLYFSYLAILRKAANHVALLQSTAGTSKKQAKYVAGICAKVFQKFPDFVERCKDEAFEALSDPMYSGKMKVLQKLLKYYLQKRDKVLLFSLSTKLLDVLESYCMAEGLDYSRLDGTTKAKDRVQIVRDFNSSSHINLCLVSTMAGGLGLNFVGANVVILFDPTWNPANDLQAIDRAYRIGQSKDVTVLRLISLGTIEEIIYLRQIYKQQLQSSVVGKESARRYFEAVQGHGARKGELFGIKNLFRLQTQGTCLTRSILEREGQVESGVMTSNTHTGEETEGAKTRVGGTGDSPSRQDDPVKKMQDSSKVPTGVLDFSSGSDEDEMENGLTRRTSNLRAADGISSGTATPGRLSLHHYGFSKFLERVREEPELEDGSSSSGGEESFSAEDDEDKKREGSTSGVCNMTTVRNGAVSTKLGVQTWDMSSGSEEDGGRQEKVSWVKQSYASRQRTGLRGGTSKFKEDKESDDNSSTTNKKRNKFKTAILDSRHCEGYSDESEDFDIETLTRPKKRTLDQRVKQGRGGGGHSKNRQRASGREKSNSAYSERIEMFTSSEDEHVPAKKGRPSACHLTATSTDRSRAVLSNDRQGAASSHRTDVRAGMSKSVSFTTLKSQTSLTSKGKDVTIDSVLGGVQEVMYTHSNQRVVGGSKAEELISRAAVRDVFQLKMYSQVPANHLVGSIESLPVSQPDSQPYPSSFRPEKPSADHPVSFTNKSVQHTGDTTFIIGETPQAIRRQQLMEMAEKFQFPSAHQFAVEILRRTSDQRLAWLQQYYTSLNHPDLADVILNNFPQPDSAQTSSSSATKTAATKSHADTRCPQKDVLQAKKKPKDIQKKPELKTKPHPPQNNVPVPQKMQREPQNDVPERPKKQKISRKNVVEPLNDLPSPESEERVESVSTARGQKRTKRSSVSASGAFRGGGGLGLDQACSSGLGSGEAAAFLNLTDRDIPSSADLSHGRSTPSSKPTGQERKQEQKWYSRTSEILQDRTEYPHAHSLPKQDTSPSGHHSLLTDLIGDTSILSDLFKPKSREAQQKGTPKTPSSLAVSTCLVMPPISSITPSNPSGSADIENTAASCQRPSKASCKDFWDILNEGNEECINRLTDPAEVQRVCINTNFAARRKSGENESKSLWKTNEKFLWKK